MTMRMFALTGVVLASLALPAGAAPPAGRAATPAARTARTASRTLEDIHIEGEIPVPQVLFITARDQRRFMDFQQRRYLRTSRQLGEATLLPSRVVATSARPHQDKETPR